MHGNPYSPLKVIHHRERLDALRRGEQIVPTQVQLIISDLCNQDCGFCAYRQSGYTANELFTFDSTLSVVGHNNPVRMIEHCKVDEILQDVHDMGIKAVQFTGGGEPTVHPQFADIYQRTLNLGLTPALVTNGVLLDKHIERVVHSAWVRISVDASTPAMYANIRRVSEGQFHRVWCNISKLVDAKRERDARNLAIGVGYVVTQDNWHGVMEFARRAKAAGVDNIRISAVFQPDDEEYFSSFYDGASRLCKDVEELETPDFKVFNLFGDRVQDLRDHSPDYEFCGYQQFNTYIGGDLNVYRCCVQSYSTHGLIGSLKHQTFRELWFSQEKTDDFDSFDARNCERCQFNSKNRTILYAIDDEPMHVNFV